ncbi:MAG TPA: hypothetical protein VMK16_06530 [Acidimicrobiales bacterium]|nr:hypothetical protein [Acidimicrobiales bacterium]
MGEPSRDLVDMVRDEDDRRARRVLSQIAEPGDEVFARTEASPSRAVFERREADGRSHARWVLEASVTPADEGSRLVMHLHYGGSLWGPVLERMLGDEIENSRPRLLACLAG